MAYFLVGGAFQNIEGGPLSNGWLTAELTAPGTDTTTTIGICNNYTLQFLLDSLGNISAAPAQFIWPTDLLFNFSGYTFPYFYRFTGYSVDGALAWGPNYIPVLSVTSVSFVNSELFVGNGRERVYNLTAAPVTNGLFVYYNGIMETNYSYNSIDNSVTFSFVPDSGSNVSIFYYFDQNVSPVFVNEIPSAVSGTNFEFTLSSMPVASTLMLYRSAIDSGGLLLTLDVDYDLVGQTIRFENSIGTDLLYAVYQTSTGYTTSRQITPTGSLNGVNKVYILQNPIFPQSLQLFWNGLEQTAGVDYELSGDNMTIIMVQAPSTGDNLTAFYNLDAIAIDFSTFTPTNPA